MSHQAQTSDDAGSRRRNDDERVQNMPDFAATLSYALRRRPNKLKPDWLS